MSPTTELGETRSPKPAPPLQRTATVLAAALLAAALTLGPAWASHRLLVEGARAEVAGGQRVPLDRIRDGRPALAHFWATWCAPCLTELPRLAQMLTDKPELAAGVLIVSVDTKPLGKVEAFLRERLDLPLSSLRVVEGTPGDVYGVTAYPATLFLTAEGTVAERIEGTAAWDDPTLRQRIAEHLAR